MKSLEHILELSREIISLEAVIEQKRETLRRYIGMTDKKILKTVRKAPKTKRTMGREVTDDELKTLVYNVIKKLGPTTENRIFHAGLRANGIGVSPSRVKIALKALKSESKVKQKATEVEYKPGDVRKQNAWVVS